MEERKTSSTGGQKGVKLARFDLIPPRPLWLLAEHFGKGAKKYAAHQWRAGVDWGDLIAALERHLMLFKMGIDYDTCSNEPDNCVHERNGEAWDGPEDTCWNHTGSHHLQAVMWMSFALMEHVEFDLGTDDRYIYNKSEGRVDVSENSLIVYDGDEAGWRIEHDSDCTLTKPHKGDCSPIEED